MVKISINYLCGDVWHIDVLSIDFEESFIFLNFGDHQEVISAFAIESVKIKDAVVME